MPRWRALGGGAGDIGAAMPAAPVLGGVGGGAATSQALASRIRRYRDRSTPWRDVIVPDGRAHPNRLRVRRSGLAPLRRRRWNAVLDAQQAAWVRRRSVSGAKAHRVTAHCRRPTTRRRRRRPDRNSIVAEVTGCRPAALGAGAPPWRPARRLQFRFQFGLETAARTAVRAAEAARDGGVNGAQVGVEVRIAPAHLRAMAPTRPAQVMGPGAPNLRVAAPRRARLGLPGRSGANPHPGLRPAPDVPPRRPASAWTAHTRQRAGWYRPGGTAPLRVVAAEWGPAAPRARR